MRGGEAFFPGFVHLNFFFGCLVTPVANSCARFDFAMRPVTKAVPRVTLHARQKRS